MLKVQITVSKILLSTEDCSSALWTKNKDKTYILGSPDLAFSL